MSTLSPWAASAAELGRSGAEGFGVGTASYKLAKVVGGLSHYAEVTATAEFGGGYSIDVSPAAFAWLKDVYGPHAWEWPVCEAYRAASESGAGFALRHIGVPQGKRTVS